MRAFKFVKAVVAEHVAITSLTLSLASPTKRAIKAFVRENLVFNRPIAMGFAVTTIFNFVLPDFRVS